MMMTHMNLWMRTEILWEVTHIQKIRVSKAFLTQVYFDLSLRDFLEHALGCSLSSINSTFLGALLERINSIPATLKTAVSVAFATTITRRTTCIVGTNTKSFRHSELVNL